MSYRQTLLDNLTDELPGLRKDPGLTWLDSALLALDTPSTSLTTKAFLSAMGNSRSVMGFLLEVRVATSCLSAFPPGSVRTEVQEGTAKSPCDVIVIDQSLRLDIQCKALQSVENELHIDELAIWLAESGTQNGLVGFFDLQAVSSATEDDFNDYRSWQQANWNQLAVPATVSFPAGSPTLIRVETHLPDLDRDLGDEPNGFIPGIIWGPVDEIDMAASEDIDRLRGRLISRFKESRRTFGFTSGTNQVNLVAIDLPSLGISDEKDLVDALYGEEFVQVPGYTVSRRTDAGLFSSGKFEYVSGLLLMSNSAPWHGLAQLVLFPHPKHIDPCKAVLAFSAFRLPQDSQGRKLISI